MPLSLQSSSWRAKPLWSPERFSVLDEPQRNWTIYYRFYIYSANNITTLKLKPKSCCAEVCLLVFFFCFVLFYRRKSSQRESNLFASEQYSFIICRILCHSCTYTNAFKLKLLVLELGPNRGEVGRFKALSVKKKSQRVILTTVYFSASKWAREIETERKRERASLTAPK